MRSPLVYFSSGQNTLSRLENFTSRGLGARGSGLGGCSSSPESRVPSPGIVTSSGFLSSRKRTKTDCRSKPSGVNSLYRTSHTSFGSTQVWSGPLGSAPCSGGSHGGVARTNAATGALGFREPDDQKVVHAVGANLEPVAGAAVAIGAVRLLGNDAFEPQGHDLLVQRLSVLLEVLRVAERAGLRQHLPQNLLALDQRQLAQIVALESEHIEHVQRGG